MSKRLAIEILQKASNPSTQSFADIEPDDDVSIIILVFLFCKTIIIFNILKYKAISNLIILEC